MSYLGIDDRSGRSGTSASRDRSRSRSNVRTSSPPRNGSYGYAPSTTTSSAMPGSFDDGVTNPSYEVRAPQGASSQYPSSTGSSSRYPPPSTSSAPYPRDDSGYTMGNYTDFPPHERPGYRPSKRDDDDLAYGSTSPVASRQPSYSGQYPGQTRQDSSSRYPPQPPSTHGRSESVSTYQYAQPPSEIKYTSRPQDGTRHSSYLQSSSTRPQDDRRHYSSASQYEPANVVDITPGHERDRTTSTSRPNRLSIATGGGGLMAPGLSTGGNHSDMPPPSPLLEAYHGTYQSISPMPLAIRDDDDLSDLEPLELTSSRSKHHANDKLEREAERMKEGTNKKRVVVYDAEGDARKMNKALNRSNVDADVLIAILPKLSHDQMWELRKEYKRQVKMQGKGINLPKHIKMKVTGNFGKAAYVTALARWESEGYWANFWYQSHGSRRELLIESLMGRTNAEIREIKNEFKDKRYNDDLVRCMEKELKMDKFRTAVLLVLEERRQEENQPYPPEYITRDVQLLHRALTAERGGETAMLEVVVLRSDAHLRAVLREYERLYKENFARAALRKSNNLVGEVIAHILNGVINKAARDALLLQHAIQDIAAKNKDDELRYELLISRLVRVHWDRMHLERVKRAYYERFKKVLEDDIEDATKGDFREFMCALAESR